MRHGEAEGRGADGDEARALTERGKDDCRRLAAHLKGEGMAWNQILCSSAQRAQESAALLAAAMDTPPALETRPELYLAGAENLLMQLRALADTANEVLLVGHNPGLHALTRFLLGRGGGNLARRAARDCPPGAIAIFSCECEAWADLKPDHAELRSFLTPSDVSYKKN
ncbi:MAG: hypothetical protein HN838_15695 [Rhodospirillaceae bacterium]|nr:hypothetical protein [Rhodospirillaceae bacterium]